MSNPVLRAISQKLRQHPGLRVGQVISNAISHQPVSSKGDIFYIPDSALARFIERSGEPPKPQEPRKRRDRG